MSPAKGKASTKPVSYFIAHAPLFHTNMENNKNNNNLSTKFAASSYKMDHRFEEKQNI